MYESSIFTITFYQYVNIFFQFCKNIEPFNTNFTCSFCWLQRIQQKQVQKLEERYFRIYN